MQHAVPASGCQGMAYPHCGNCLPSLNGLQSFPQEWSCQHPFLPRLPEWQSQMGTVLPEAWWGSRSWDCWAPCIKCPRSLGGRSLCSVLAVCVLRWPGSVCIDCLFHICLRDMASSPRSVFSFWSLFCPSCSSTSKPSGPSSAPDSSLNSIEACSS